MNPLDTGTPFSLEFRNPQPRSRMLKEGPRYTVTFEITKEAHDEMMAARCLPGMLLEGVLTVTHQGTAVGPRPYGHIASALFAKGFFHHPDVRRALGDPERTKAADVLARELAREWNKGSIGDVSPAEMMAWCQERNVPFNVLPVEYRPR